MYALQRDLVGVSKLCEQATEDERLGSRICCVQNCSTQQDVTVLGVLVLGVAVVKRGISYLHDPHHQWC